MTFSTKSDICCKNGTSMIHFIMHNYANYMEYMTMTVVWVTIYSQKGIEIFQPPIQRFMFYSETTFKVAQLFGITKAGKQNFLHVLRFFWSLYP